MANNEAIDRLNALKRLNDEIELLDTDDINNLRDFLIENSKARENAYLENLGV